MDSKYEKMFWSKHNECLKLKDQLNSLLENENNKIDKFVIIKSIGKIVFLNNDKQFGKIKYGDSEYYFNKKSSNIHFNKLKIDEKYNIKFIPAYDKRFKTQVYIESRVNETSYSENKTFSYKKPIVDVEYKEIEEIKEIKATVPQHYDIIKDTLVKQKNTELQKGQLIGYCNNSINMYCYYLINEVLDNCLKVFYLKRKQNDGKFKFRKVNELVIPKSKKIDIYI